MDSGPTSAETMMRALVSEGVTVVFANPGTTEMWLVGAMDKIPSIRPILCLHETVCSGAADGYARMTRKPACTVRPRPDPYLVLHFRARGAPSTNLPMHPDFLQVLHLGPGLANAIANLHNARRANSPLINIVGDMATWHHGADALLEMDIESLARTVSAHVHTSTLPGSLRADALEALRATKVGAFDAPISKGRVATLIVPHDRSSERPGKLMEGLMNDYHDEDISNVCAHAAADMRDFLSRCATTLLAASPGKTAIFCGGEALLAESGSLQAAGTIAAMIDGELIIENAFSRLDRGGDLPHPKRLPYFPNDAAKALAAFDVIVTVGARRPVAMFGYDGAGPSHLLRLDESKIWELDAGAMVPEMLTTLRDEVARQLGRETTLKNKDSSRRKDWTVPKTPPSPSRMNTSGERLTAAEMCMMVAAVQPEGAIVVDESLTSGGAYWDASARCPRFTHLSLTGGAIGFGPPAAVGAAIACPDRKVINLQADGSGLYAPQALWTQARERLDVVTIVCSNAKYAILKLELALQKVGVPGSASRELTDITNPQIDWTSLARGFGVPARRAETAYELGEALREALNRAGPSLIEAVLQ